MRVFKTIKIKMNEHNTSNISNNTNLEEYYISVPNINKNFTNNDNFIIEIKKKKKKKLINLCLKEYCL